MKTVKDLKVGDSVWIFDVNRRRYSEDRRGGPIWEGHWCHHTITSETSRSFVISRYRKDIKIPKNGDAVSLSEFCNDIAYSLEEIALKKLLHQRGRIGEMVRLVDDVDVIQKVAAIVGFTVELGPVQGDGTPEGEKA